MKILLVSSSLDGGGAERIMLLLADFWVRRGHTIHVGGLDGGAAAYGLSKEIKTFHFKTAFINRGFLKLLCLPLQALELAIRLKKMKPDATLSFLVRANFVNVLAGFFRRKRPIVLSHRNITQGLYGSGGIRDRIMLLMIKKLYPKADRIIAISEGVKTSLVASGIDSSRITVIPNFIDYQMIGKPPKTSFPIPMDKPIIVSAGRLIEQKDFATLLRAFTLVKASLDARLMIVGAGPLDRKLKAQAHGLGIARDVIFTGWIANPFEVMKKAHLFVLCSRYEGFGNVIIEAMACGLPVICTDCPGGPREILANGRYGKLVKIGDAKQIAESIIEVLGNPDIQQKMGVQSSLRAGAYRIECMAPRYLETILSPRHVV
jgi:glycosyltransferase involved in cell wall biosynthesis